MMSNDNKKEELVRLLSEVESQAQRIEAIGQDIVLAARFTLDIVNPFRTILLQVPDDTFSSEQLDGPFETWRSWQVLASEIETSRTTVDSFNAVSFAATSTSTAAITAVTLPSQLSPKARDEVEDSKLRLHQTLERFPLIDNARLSMQRLRLDVRGGCYRTPLELLDDAHGALERPVSQDGGSVSILIALRESIESTIAELLRQRPKQEPAGNVRKKITSLGRQCARPGLHEPHFDRLASDAAALIDKLSGAKQADLPRQQLNELFHQGLLFLNALMNSIDESRLKSA